MILDVTAGFWAGITVGRFTLVHFTRQLGEKTFTTLLTIGSFALEIAVWRWPSIIGDSVFIALIGLLLGPICPFAASVFTRLLPSGRQQSTAMAFIWGAGSSGGAAAPFVTGLLAQVVRDGGKTGGGTWILHPVALVLYAVMMVCWLSLPRERKQLERRQ